MNVELSYILTMSEGIFHAGKSFFPMAYPEMKGVHVNNFKKQDYWLTKISFVTPAYL